MQQSAIDLKQLLASGPVVSDHLTAVASFCREWFRRDGTLPCFVLMAVFDGLIQQGFDDQQGVSGPTYNLFAVDVLPSIVALCDSLVNGSSLDHDIHAREVIRSFQELLTGLPHPIHATFDFARTEYRASKQSQ